MPDDPQLRRLTTIVALDVAGYSARTEADEDRTAAEVDEAYRSADSARLGLVDFWLTTGRWPDCVDEVPYDFRAECEKARHIPIEAFGF